MRKSTAITLFIVALAASVLPEAGYAQAVCAYPAQWVWRGYWSCEYPARMYYAPPAYYPYYGYNHGHYSGYAGRGYAGGGAYHGGGGHIGGGVRGGGHSGGGHGGHR